MQRGLVARSLRSTWFTALTYGGMDEDVDNELVRKLIWSGMVTASTALAGLVAARLAGVAYRRIFNEEPPE